MDNLNSLDEPISCHSDVDWQLDFFFSKKKRFTSQRAPMGELLLGNYYLDLISWTYDTEALYFFFNDDVLSDNIL